MPDQINIRDLPDTPPNESLNFMLGFIAGDIKRRSGQRTTSSEIVRVLVRKEYERLVKAQKAEATK
jgi:hypothetical protein